MCAGKFAIHMPGPRAPCGIQVNQRRKPHTLPTAPHLRSQLGVRPQRSPRFAHFVQVQEGTPAAGRAHALSMFERKGQVGARCTAIQVLWCSRLHCCCLAWVNCSLVHVVRPCYIPTAAPQLQGLPYRGCVSPHMRGACKRLWGSQEVQRCS